MTTREIKVRADLERTGDADAVKKVADDLKQLEGAAKGTSTGLAETGRSSAIASSDAQQLAQKVNQLEQELKETKAALDRANKELRDFGDGKGRVDGLRSSFTGLKTAILGLGIGSAFFALKNGIEEVVEASDRQEKALAQIDAALESTRGISGLTAQELSKIASSMQEVTTFADEVVLEMQSILLTFTKVGREIFPEVTERVLDLATRMDGDLKGAAVQLGKALNDPIQGITALSRSGIQFTEAQKETIKSLVESGNHLEAQKIILAELESQFGGSARAARDTFGGSLDAAKNLAGDLLEKIGEGGLSAALQKLANDFLQTGEQGSSAFTRIGQVAGTVIIALKAAATGIATGFQAIAGLVGTLGAGMADQLIGLGKVFSEALDQLGFDDLSDKIKEKLDFAQDAVAEFRKNVLGDTLSELQQGRESLKTDLDAILEIWNKSASDAQAGAEGYRQAAGAVREMGDEVERSAGKLSESAKRFLSSLPGVVDETAAELKERASGIAEALEGSLGGVAGVFALPPETKEKIKSELEEIVASYRQLGEKIDPILANHAQNLGIIIGAYERAADGATQSSTKIGSAAQASASAITDAALAQKESISIVTTSVNELGEAMVEQTEVSREAAAAMSLEEIEAAPERLRQYAKAVQEADAELQHAGTGAEQTAGSLNKAAETAQEAYGSIADSASTAAGNVDQAALAQKESISIVTTSVNELGETMISQSEITREAAQKMTLEEIEQAPERLQEYAKAVQQAGEDLKSTGGEADQAAGEIKKPGDQADQAGAKLSKLSEATSQLTEASEQSAESLKKQADALKDLSNASEVSGVSKLKAELIELRKLEFAEKVLEQLGAIQDKAKDAAAAIREIDNAAGEKPSSKQEPSAQPIPEAIVEQVLT